MPRPSETPEGSVEGEMHKQPSPIPNLPDWPLQPGRRAFFWTGRGSFGFCRIRAVTAKGRVLIDPDEDAVKGSDFRQYAAGSRRENGWTPRDYGVLLRQLNSTPEFFYFYR